MAGSGSVGSGRVRGSTLAGLVRVPEELIKRLPIPGIGLVKSLNVKVGMKEGAVPSPELNLTTDGTVTVAATGSDLVPDTALTVGPRGVGGSIGSHSVRIPLLDLILGRGKQR